MTEATQLTAAILLITVPAIAFGGTFMLRVLSGGVATTAQQRSFFRAGHAHAGVLVTLSLVALLYIDGADITGIPASVASTAITASPILIPAGFFFSMIGAGRTEPNGFKALIYLGAVSLGIGTLTLGVALL